ncbi:hypothetical protein CLAFUW4_00949 [Fulvia fulva]|uniref:Uncharacterized protein n=1 Tax=Passalora fulva TaxID=5499 RepID=A0A9Q8P3T3_PASFU|nr:uncharacterized protein CLAFUR5_00955 [Fulvia fulva]KAK4635673.1 hypothetical protein CLAFUR4_00950 [Fulvia fulva]KAK4638238.1 hypothetical protein CLAFUR0_00951 [Fulvia fulva]UJO12017.1 hypothetical protein CLAFUR5_00955 [Fulvia fulva]WPV10214.1 hypothetical protein CLAFUW4_00949 [Fulvia fulva]WPV25006.1 hypothetical protein CLAFUW7_00867 [Fulvia fulva]
MDERQQPAHSSDQIRRPGHTSAMPSRSAESSRRMHPDTESLHGVMSRVDSWIDVSSQPSSSSLSSAGEEIVTTGLRVQDDPRTRRRRTQRSDLPTHLHITRTQSAGGTSSQEEYEESESESDRIMTSSGEGPMLAAPLSRPSMPFVQRAQQPSAQVSATVQDSDDDDENRTAINYPINNDTCFTPLPNAFSHPPSAGQARHASQPVPDSYFPATRSIPATRSSTRQSLPANMERRHSHLPHNVLSPSFNAAAEHDEALRASLTSLLSVAAAARGLPKVRPQAAETALPPRSNRVDPSTFRMVPESALPVNSPTQFQEPTFKPTIRRTSTNSTSTSDRTKDHKRKAVAVPTRSASRERRALKKARRSASTEDLHVTPTLLTWVVSAGIVVCLSALSFTAGYTVGKEAGRLEATELMADEQLRTCAREAGRSSLGLKRSLARSAIQA